MTICVLRETGRCSPAGSRSVHDEYGTSRGQLKLNRLLYFVPIKHNHSISECLVLAIVSYCDMMLKISIFCPGLPIAIGRERCGWA